MKVRLERMETEFNVTDTHITKKRFLRPAQAIEKQTALKMYCVVIYTELTEVEKAVITQAKLGRQIVHRGESTPWRKGRTTYEDSAMDPDRFMGDFDLDRMKEWADEKVKRDMEARRPSPTPDEYKLEDLVSFDPNKPKKRCFAVADERDEFEMELKQHVFPTIKKLIESGAEHASNQFEL